MHCLSKGLMLLSLLLLQRDSDKDNDEYFLNLFIYLFLAALGLRCCVRASSSCGERELLFTAGRGLLIAVASLAVEHRL